MSQGGKRSESKLGKTLPNPVGVIIFHGPGGRSFSGSSNIPGHLLQQKPIQVVAR